MRSQRAITLALGAWSLRLTPVAAETDCNNVVITSANHARQVGQGCSTIQGNVTFDTAESVNLDGVEVIRGNVSNIDEQYDCQWYPSNIERCDSTSLFTIEMPSLTRVDGNVEFRGYVGLANLSLPQLKEVNQFSLWRMHNLTTMDITKLDTVSHFYISDAKSLSTMHHEGLRHFTGRLGGRDTLYVASTALDSVDSIFVYPFNLTDTPNQSQGLGFEMMPNLQRATFGLTSAAEVRFGGNNVTVTLGGPETTSMNLSRIVLQGGVANFERHENLKTLTVDEVHAQRSSNNMTTLMLPFDQLRKLTVRDAGPLKRLRNLPQATSWIDFEMDVSSLSLNMTSLFEADRDGKMVQTWFWPEQDMEKIRIWGGNLTNELFKPYVDRYNTKVNSSDAAQVIRQFSLGSSERTTEGFDCALFDQLNATGAFPESYRCSSQPPKSSGHMMRPASVGLLALICILSCLTV